MMELNRLYCNLCIYSDRSSMSPDLLTSQCGSSPCVPNSSSPDGGVLKLNSGAWMKCLVNVEVVSPNEIF